MIPQRELMHYYQRQRQPTSLWVGFAFANLACLGLMAALLLY